MQQSSTEKYGKSKQKVNDKCNKVGENNVVKKKYKESTKKYVKIQKSKENEQNPPGTMKNHENPPGTMKKHENQARTIKKQPRTMKNQPQTMKNHENPPGTMNLLC